MIRHIPLSQVDWPGIKDKIPITHSEYDEQRYNELWSQFDSNGNGMVSIAEADLCLKRLGGPLIPIYYSKKVQIIAFNLAKKESTDEKKEYFIDRTVLPQYLFNLILYFGYYFLFKKLDTDADDRLKVEDLILAFNLTKMWGAEYEDIKALKKSYNKYEEGHSGFILFEQFCKFAEENKFDVEKDPDIIKKHSAPRIIYKQKEFMRAGTKRPNQIDPSKWKKRKESPVDEISQNKTISRLSRRSFSYKLKKKDGMNISNLNNSVEEDSNSRKNIRYKYFFQLAKILADLRVLAKVS